MCYLNKHIKGASNEIRTRVIGFKVQCADHYTMEAKTLTPFVNQCHVFISKYGIIDINI